MLLEVRETYNSTQQVTLDVDFYIPFSFSAGQLVEPYHWRALDGSGTMLELDVDRSPSAIFAGCLVTYKEQPRSGAPPQFNNPTLHQGLPIVANLPPPDRGRPARHDHHGEVRLYHDASNYFVTLSSESTQPECIISSRVGFFVSNKILVGLGFFELTNSEINILSERFLALEQGK